MCCHVNNARASTACKWLLHLTRVDTARSNILLSSHAYCVDPVLPYVLLAQAVAHYTMAIRLSRSPAAVLFNNRAAAYGGLAYWGKSLDDAGGCCVHTTIECTVCSMQIT